MTTLIKRCFYFHRKFLLGAVIIFLLGSVVFLGNAFESLQLFKFDALNENSIYELLSPETQFMFCGIGISVLISRYNLIPRGEEQVRVRHRSWYQGYVAWFMGLILITCAVFVLIACIIYCLIKQRLLHNLFQPVLVYLGMVETLILLQLFITFLVLEFKRINYLFLACCIYVLLWTGGYGEKLFVIIQKFSNYWWFKYGMFQEFFYQSLIVWALILLMYLVNEFLFDRWQNYA